MLFKLMSKLNKNKAYVFLRKDSITEYIYEARKTNSVY